jgi:mannose-6-phosphate isomerase-like protein (cupin superfamily)
MARTGQLITNPITGEHITFTETAHDTAGARMRFDCHVSPGGPRLPAHVHRTYEERFAVVAGTLGVMLGGRTALLRAGESIALPAMIAHQWWNAGDDDVRFQVTVMPPHDIETVLEVICVMAQSGRLNRRCMPKNPFELAHLARLSESYLAGVPIWVQRGALALLASIGALLGYRADLALYRHVVTSPAMLKPRAVSDGVMSEREAA